MNVLSIGNSFSRDAQRYLHEIAASEGEKINSFNLYIGSCSLSRHYRNMLSGERAYFLDVNGLETEFQVSLQEALLNRDWDVVTLQQASGFSTNFEHYEPYLSALCETVRRYAPKAKIVIHQTWSYEEGSEKLAKLGYTSQKDMFSDLEKAYRRAYESVQADALIPSGALFQRLLANGVEKIHRDTYHATLGLGRFALGLLWYASLTGKDVSTVSFSLFDRPVSQGEIELAKKCVAELSSSIF